MEDLALRDIDNDIEDIIYKRKGFSVYDTEQTNRKRCPDCNRFGHCEC